ncbi:hypothetical protein CERSUDRAFT_97718 [Gelatoporia subvermispora B]|uniref:Uncharacterized protein n=1 Tax=Ceriporiopsis subvermispora (strain B) TaxID=914234 RepID=M2QQM8_CERS8|nr:hypothetical protein CERSUDRAFT_97718 [Gelatoporia subvermispora B]
MFKQLFLVLAAAICTVSASPVTSLNCGGTIYQIPSVQRNLAEGVRLQQLGQTIPSGDSGSAVYPHKYNDLDGLNLAKSCARQLWDFPLVKGAKAFGRFDHAGPDRVVFLETGVYCASITHIGASNPNGFALCRNV